MAVGEDLVQGGRLTGRDAGHGIILQVRGKRGDVGCRPRSSGRVGTGPTSSRTRRGCRWSCPSVSGKAGDATDLLRRGRGHLAVHQRFDQDVAVVIHDDPLSGFGRRDSLKPLRIYTSYDEPEAVFYRFSKSKFLERNGGPVRPRWTRDVACPSIAIILPGSGRRGPRRSASLARGGRDAGTSGLPGHATRPTPAPFGPSGPANPRSRPGRRRSWGDASRISP